MDEGGGRELQTKREDDRGGEMNKNKKGVQVIPFSSGWWPGGAGDRCLGRVTHVAPGTQATIQHVTRRREGGGGGGAARVHSCCTAAAQACMYEGGASIKDVQN